MKKNIVTITGLLIAVLAASAIFHSLYVRISTSKEPAYKAARELSHPTDVKHSTPSSYERDRNMESLIQQVSIISQNMNTIQDQINVLFARIDAEGTSEEEGKETIDSSIAKENPQEKSPVEPPSIRYTNETRDDQWASPAEAAIATELTTNPLVAGVAIDTIDCRTSTCRVVWQYQPDMTSEEAFATENEMVTAMNRAGFNASSQATLGGGSTEGIFWYTPPPEVAPGSSSSSLLSGGR